jgi:hypothetical protein
VIRRVDRLFGVVIQDKTDVGPRFGLNYALTRDRKNLARASWVRAHDVLPRGSATAGRNTPGKRDLYDVNLDGVFETVLVTPASTAASTNQVFDLERRGQPYIDEWQVGLRRQFRGRLMADAAFVHRQYRGRYALVDKNGIYENGVFKGYRDERQNEIYLITNNEWNWHVYSGLELQVTKDSAKARFLGSYTRAWRHIAGTWQPLDPASFIQPNAFPNDKGIGRVVPSGASIGLDANGLTGTHMTDGQTNWQDHVARVGAVYNAPAGFVIASHYVFQSGNFGGPVVTRTAADPRFGPPTVRLSNGRVVNNPLATPIRFAYPTRGEGQLKLPAIHVWNLRLGRQFKLGGERRLEIGFDVFNVLNRDSDTLFQSGANQQYSANYGRTFARQEPRSYRVSARVAF